MALMLRAIGIPSRNVTGFVGGTWNRFGQYYAVREGDAHSWVEAYVDHPVHPGWQTFDPTPPSGAQPLEPPGGAYYYIRDFIEALSQRWNTYVVGYDLRKQVRIFDEISRRYDRLRSRAGIDRGPLANVTRGPVLAGAALALVGIVYAAWKRRQKRAATHERQADERPPDPRAQTSAALYRLLETALQSQGIARAPSVPPLRHAEELLSRQHPLANEILALTTVYIETRFGGSVLTEIARRDFERRVRDIRAFRAERSAA